ncbi:transglutaminaseTgpA domain-containing protein [Alteromonas flava]|uniref:transglutaminase family protein n=1 Tax=Alteromonas flava TaxID=2048003 RepID=UPI000C28EF61|nr:DUF3488 and transglutaminase-like domain-containing protein [Alteromonas flava]
MTSTLENQSANAHSLERSLCVLILAIAYALITATMVTPLLIWILILAASATITRVVLFARPNYQPLTNRSINLLAVLAAIALAWFSLQLGLLLTMVNLLVMACAFKLMRINAEKDIRQLAATLLFLIGCGFIFQQGIAYSLLYVMITLLVLAGLHSFNAPSLTLQRHVKSIGMMLAQALPIAVTLFLILPQLPPLWQMPTSKGAMTGLSDSVTPGDFAELSQSTDLAFRAIFTNSPPPNYQRYWRVMTLEAFDGKTWSIASQRRQLNRQYQQARREFTPELDGPFWQYEVIAEPSHQRWLFALDIARARAMGDTQIKHGHEYQLLASRPVVSPMRYSVQSYYAEPLNQTLFSVDRRINRQLPQSGNPQTQQWVAELRQQYPENQSLLQALQEHFISSGFRYTLKPNPMPTNPVDQFLFEHKAGFCAHYASALAYILRLSDIPARMVTGYQGGEELSPNVISVHQYDAHAWVEAWVDERGWVRLDPTAWVSPGRIEFGLEHAMQDEGSFLEDAPLSLARLKNIELFNQLRLWFAEMDYQWSKWILGFDSQQQYDLLQQWFGELTAQKLSMIGVGAVMIISLLLGLYILPQLRRHDAYPMNTAYHQCNQLIENLTGIKRGTLGATEYLAKVRTDLPPTIAKIFAEATRAYVQSEYRKLPSQRDNKAVLQQMRNYRKSLKKQIEKAS